MNKKGFALAFICVIVLSSCTGEDSVEKVTPTNLIIASIISTDGSGLVTFQAAADFAVEYEFYFGENPSAVGYISTDGAATYSYLTTGTYVVKVIASSSDDISINETISITIQVNEKPILDVGFSTPKEYAGMNLVWFDEFEGTTLNTTDWTHETGGNWFNNEQQYYQEANTTVKNGYLTITAKSENVGGRNYTSSRIITQDKKVFKYGRIDIRAILPKGQGMWPALWMLGSSISTAGWPKCGEIDIMEMIGGTTEREKTVYGTLHWDNAGTKVCTCDKPGYVLNSGSFNDKFHVFTITWDASFIIWYVDDVQFNKIDITPGELDEFTKEFFFIFNLAVGGDWPGNPDGSTIFPQKMVVDYIRVFQLK